jgi:hypothetical protein
MARVVAVEVAHGLNTSLGISPLQLILGDCRIEIASEFDEGALRRLIRVLREPTAC